MSTDSADRALGRIEEKVDELKRCYDEDRKSYERRDTATQKRIDLVEKWQSRIITGGSVVSGMVLIAYKIIFDYKLTGH